MTARWVAAAALTAACAWLVGCAPKKPPDGPPPEYEPGRAWTPDGKPVPRGSASAAPSAAPRGAPPS